MGLRKDRNVSQKRVLAGWWLPAVLVSLGLVLLFTGAEGLAALRYDRSAIADGALWRLLSGHFVHLGTGHYVLNAAGLLLVWYLTGTAFSARQWGLVILGSLVAMDLGFWLLMPGLDWYVGLSGLLHGLLAAGAIGLWRRRRNEALLLLGILAAKLAYEGAVGPLPGSADTAGGPVITEAHLFGALGGFLTALLISRSVGRRSSL